MIIRRLAGFISRACSLRVCGADTCARTGAAATGTGTDAVRVITFDGGWNLPMWAAQRQGFFEANGVAVQLSYTPNSAALVTGLFDGRYDIALATIDNFIAYQEGQGEAKIPDNPDLFAFIGGDSGFLSIMASPGGEVLRRPQGQDAVGRRDDQRPRVRAARTRRARRPGRVRRHLRARGRHVQPLPRTARRQA